MYSLAQVEMLRTIEQETAVTRLLTGRHAISSAVMAAMARVPRADFVPAELRRQAYGNYPLPIGCGQTISQPFIVALMTDLLDPSPAHTVLEVGTGSGYQAAILSLLVERIYSVELVPELAASARQLLTTLGYRNVTVRNGDGYAGWTEHAPFDGIIVTAAATEIPEPLVSQLRPGGRMVIPVGPPFGHQELLLVAKDPVGEVKVKEVLGVAFVPLLHGH